MKDMKKTDHIKSNSKGFTLIELLIAMAISGIVAGAIFTAFQSQQKSYLLQDQVTEMQQNLRGAMLMISGDARMAGFGFGGYVNSINNQNENDDPDNPDCLDILYADAGVTTNLRADMPPQSAIFGVDSTDGFAINDLIIITDGTNGTLLRITQVLTGSIKLQHNPSAVINPPGGHNTFPTPDGYGPGSKIYKLRYLSYDIDNTDPNHPTMRVDFDGPFGGGGYQPLADNVEDLQAAFIFEDGGEADTYDDTDGDDTNDYDDIRSVRITILARTDRTDSGFSGQRPAIEDHAAGNPDNYRRRLLTSVIKIRNLGL